MSNRFWLYCAHRELEAALSNWQSLHARYLTQLRSLPAPPRAPDRSDSEVKLETQYGAIPQVMADFNVGAIFPRPIEPPLRMSYFQASRQLVDLQKSFDAYSAELEEWQRADPYRQQALAEIITNRTLRLHEDFLKVAALMHALDSWLLPTLRLPLQSPSDPSRKPPKRVIQRDYVPPRLEDFKGSSVVIPIATDIEDRNFLEEFEGAVDTYWNHWPALKKVQTHFRVSWLHVAPDQDFALGKITLEEHLMKFPKGPAVLTTGALTHHVHDNALILSRDPITVRTLAHEFGHLLGFVDCYSRTASGQGGFGVALLEWGNPYYPDELMCDDTVGVVRDAVW